jgi:hypothetical protein
MNNKNIIICFLLLVISYLFGCAPKVAPPPLYKNIDLSLDDVITTSRRDIHSLKAIAGINIEKNNAQYSYIEASLTLRKPGSLQMRWYRFGMLAGNLLIKDHAVQTVTGKGVDTFKTVGSELYSSVFWWDNIDNASMHKKDKQYVIRAENREILLDAATLMPKSQEITAAGRKILIAYDKPKRVKVMKSGDDLQDDYWYPSVMKIIIDAYRFTVKVEKMIINPELNERDFTKQEDIQALDVLS